MAFHISEEKFDQLLDDMKEVVREEIMDIFEWTNLLNFGGGLTPRHRVHIAYGFEGLLNEATEHQMTSDMYGLSYVIFDKLDNFMIGLQAIETRIDITYSQEDVIHSLNSILDETLNDSLQDKITVDWAEDD
jgi:hypothetical protein